MSQAIPSAPRTAPTSRAARSLRAAHLSLAASSLFLILLAVLHFLKPDLNPSWSVISEYALGAYGWMMTLAFASLAAGCASLVMAAWPLVRAKVGRFGLVLLAVSAAGCALAAIFPTDPVTASFEEATTQGSLHGTGAALAGLIPYAAALFTWGLSRGPVSAAIRRSLWLATVIAWLGMGVFAFSMATRVPPDGRLGPDVHIGWPNRIMIVAYCVWVMVAAWRTAQLHGEKAP